MKYIINFFKTDTNFLSKDMTDQYRGWCILVIVLHHVSQRLQSPGLLGIFVNAGPKAVSMFFFLSAYGLTVSFLNNQNYMDNFIRKRLFRLYAPFVVINILTIIISAIVFNDYYDIEYVLLSIVGTTELTYQWFIIIILLFYLLFWVAFRFFPKWIAPLALTAFVAAYMIAARYFGLSLWYYESSLGFPLGIAFGWHRARLNKLLTEYYLATFLLVSISYISLMSIRGLELYWLKILIFTFIVLMVLSKTKIRPKGMQFVGRLSLEIFLIHMLIYYVYSEIAEVQGYQISIYVTTVILFAFVFRKALNAGYCLVGALQK